MSKPKALVEFQILDEKRYSLKTEDSIIQLNKRNKLIYHRWEHRVTLGYNGKTFMVFIDNGDTNKNIFPSIYIEEISANGLERIEDDSLFDSLLNYAQENGFVNMLPPMLL
jgi:hypothetical protein